MRFKSHTLDFRKRDIAGEQTQYAFFFGSARYMSGYGITKK